MKSLKERNFKSVVLECFNRGPIDRDARLKHSGMTNGFPFEASGHHKAQSGFSLISVIFMLIALGAMGLTMAPLLTNRSHGAVEDYQGQQAFYVADGGLQYVLMNQFYNQNNFNNATTVSNVALGGGTFSSSHSSVTTTTANVTITGTVQNSVRVLQQSIQKIYSASGAIHSGGDTEMESSQSGGGNIIGDMSCGTSTCSLDGGYSHSGNINPNVTPPGTVSLTSLQALTTSTVTGNLNINGGTYTNNVRVTGNVNIQGNVTVTGIIVADGNVNLAMQHGEVITLNGTLAAAGDIDFSAQQSSAGTLTAQQAGGMIQPLLIAVGDINFSDFQDTDFTFNGLIRAGGNIDFKLRQDDELTINGGVVANGDITSDSKQSSSLVIDFTNGQQYLSSSLQLTSWKES